MRVSFNAGTSMVRACSNYIPRVPGTQRGQVAAPHRGCSQQPSRDSSAVRLVRYAEQDMEEPDADTNWDRLAEEHPQDLSRLRLDAWAISWGNRHTRFGRGFCWN